VNFSVVSGNIPSLVLSSETKMKFRMRVKQLKERWVQYFPLLYGVHWISSAHDIWCSQLSQAYPYLWVFHVGNFADSCVWERSNSNISMHKGPVTYNYEQTIAQKICTAEPKVASHKPGRATKKILLDTPTYVSQHFPPGPQLCCCCFASSSQYCSTLISFA
jgi:hypothetical protein